MVEDFSTQSNVLYLHTRVWIRVVPDTLYIDEYAKLINLTISRIRKKIFERLKMDFEGKE